MNFFGGLFSKEGKKKFLSSLLLSIKLYNLILMGCNSTEMEDIGELERVKLRIRALEAKLTLTPEEMTLLASYILKENRLTGTYSLCCSHHLDIF